MPPADQILRRRAQALAGSLNSHRIVLYGVVSTIAMCAAIVNALKSHSNFYSVAIYLSKSSRSVLVLANFAFLVALACGHVVQRIFFGSLRANEVERLYDRLWFFITESLLAFTIFRDDFDVPFALMFGFLLFVKSFHWLAGDRMEWMDQRPYPGPPFLFHIRMMCLFFILFLTDIIMFLVAIESTLAYGVGGMVLFASEYGILTASINNTICKYLLTVYELRRASLRGGENAPPWENKSMWTFYIELVTDFMKLTVYLTFFILIITFYGLPLNIVRDVYITARSFVTRLRALHRYQSATRNMDQRYPNATEAEMAAMSDRTCIICREEMTLQAQALAGATPTEGPNTTPKKLPCGHIFHFYCLRSWLERQQSCPTCRRTVFEANPAGAQAQNPPPPAGAGPAPPQNFQGIPGQQNQDPQARPLNGGGWAARIFGQPPPAVAPGQAVPNPTVTYNPPGQGAGVVIQYNIQYQQPPPLTQRPFPPGQVPALQPVPQFPGFHGPGGAWYGFPRHLPNQNQLANNNATPTVPGSPPASNQSSQSPPVQANGSEAASSGQPSGPASDQASAPSDARAAAAQAAIRRFGGDRSSTTSRTPGSSAQRQPAAGPSTAPEQPRPTPTAPIPTTSSTFVPRVEVPSLIPLADYEYLKAALPQSQQTFGSPNGTARPTNPTRTAQQPQFPPLQPSSSNQLPQSLTEQQLSIMDQLTREAIDERLRVLEGVSATVSRCVDDLLRMRSILPPQGGAPAGMASSASSSSASSSSSTGGAQENGSASLDAKGKQPASSTTHSHNGGGRIAADRSTTGTSRSDESGDA